MLVATNFHQFYKRSVIWFVDLKSASFVLLDFIHMMRHLMRQLSSASLLIVLQASEVIHEQGFVRLPTGIS